MTNGTMHKHQRAMLRAAVEAVEERAQARIDELADKVLPGSQRVALEIPASNVTNHIDTTPIAEAIKSVLFTIEHQPIVTNTIDVSPIVEAVDGVLSAVGKQQAPQVSVDMGPVALAVGDSLRGVVEMVSVQNDKIAVLSDALTKLLRVLADQKPVESPSIIALVKDQREFFARMLGVIVDNKKPRRIRIKHGDEESTVVEE